MLPNGDEVDVDMHTQQVTLLPTSTEGLSIPPALLFTKDQTQEIMIVVTVTESKKTKSKLKVYTMVEIWTGVP